MKNKVRLIDILIYIILIGMSISPAFALGEGNRNLLLIGVMCLSPFVILRYMEFDKRDFLLMLFVGVLIFATLLNHPETMRWSTVLYTCLFCLTFMAYSRLLRHSSISVYNYEKILKYIIYAYTIVLLIQQFCVLTGLPIFNLSNYDPQTPWKLNSLSSEPAHSARVVSLLMYCYVYIKKHITGNDYTFKHSIKDDKWIWIAYLWTMLTMGSASAILFLGIVLTIFFNKHSFWPMLIVTTIFITIVNMMDLNTFERTLKVVKATLVMEEKVIMQTDGSAAARIVPTVVLLKEVTIFSTDGLFGHGVDQTKEDRVVNMSSVGYGKTGVTGGCLTVWYDYGFLAFIMWMIFSIGVCINLKEPIGATIFWFLFIFLFGLNNQFVWLTITLLYTNKKITL